MAHLRYTLRQPISATEGKTYLAMNDGVEVVDDAGNVIADLSDRVRSIELIDEVGSPRMVRLELFAGEIAAETEPDRSGVLGMPRRAEG